MKIKNDFVTNSSSASFILNIESTANSIEEFIELWNKYIEDFIMEHRWKIDLQVEERVEFLKNQELKKIELKEKIDKQEATEEEIRWYEIFYSHVNPFNFNIPIEEFRKIILGEMNFNHIVGSVYSVEHSVNMFNCISDDVPEWMIYLIVLNNMGSNLLKYGFKNIKFEIEDDH